MDVASISPQPFTDVPAQVSVRVLRKALDLQESQALQLLQALPRIAPVVSPGASLGGWVNTYA